MYVFRRTLIVMIQGLIDIIKLNKSSSWLLLISRDIYFFLQVKNRDGHILYTYFIYQKQKIIFLYMCINSIYYSFSLALSLALCVLHFSPCPLTTIHFHLFSKDYTHPCIVICTNIHYESTLSVAEVMKNKKMKQKKRKIHTHWRNDSDDDEKMHLH